MGNRRLFWSIVEKIEASDKPGMNFNFDTVGVGGGDYTIIYELINENDPDKSLSTDIAITVDYSYFEALQVLANSMAVSATENDITATLNQNISNRSGSTLKAISSDTQFNWAIFYVNKAEDATPAVYGSTKAPINNGSEGMKFSALSSRTSYQVGLVINHKGRSTELVKSEIISTKGTANLPTVEISGGKTVVEDELITLEAIVDFDYNIKDYN